MSIRSLLNTEGVNIGRIGGRYLAIETAGNLTATLTVNDSLLLTSYGSGGVDSVNGDYGPNVVLDTDDINETINKVYVTPAEKSQITTNTNDIDTLQTDVGTLQADVGTLQADVGDLQTDVSTLQMDVTNIQTDINNLTTDDVAETLTRVYVSPAERTQITTNQTNIGALQIDTTTNNGANQIARVASNGWLPYNIIRSNRKFIDGTFTNNPTPNEQPSIQYNLTDNSGNALLFKDCTIQMLVYNTTSAMPLPNTGSRWQLIYPSQDGTSIMSIYSSPVNTDGATGFVFYRRLDRYDNLPFRIIYTW